MPMSEPTVKACPVCGNEVLNTCFHDGEDISSVEMPVIRAAELVVNYITQLEVDLEESKDELKKYQSKLAV